MDQVVLPYCLTWPLTGTRTWPGKACEYSFLRDSMPVDGQLLAPIDDCTDSPPTPEGLTKVPYKGRGVSSRTNDFRQNEGPVQRKGVWMGLPRVL